MIDKLLENWIQLLDVHIFNHLQNIKYIPLKGKISNTFHPKMKILSSFTHLQVAANLYEFLSSAEHKEDILKKDWNQSVVGHQRLP